MGFPDVIVAETMKFEQFAIKLELAVITSDFHIAAGTAQNWSNLYMYISYAATPTRYYQSLVLYIEWVQQQQYCVT
jgi:hypothetical protein